MPIPKITKKQQHILQLIYRYRFLTRTHIQSLLNHASHTLINTWLADLRDKKYLNRIYSTAYGENIKPAEYYLSTNGINLMKQAYPDSLLYIQNLYYEKKRSEQFRLHCFALADISCKLFAFAAKQQQEIMFMTKADYALDVYADTYDLFSYLKPDGFYTYSGDGIAKAAFILVIDDTVPSFILRKTVQRYIRAYNELDWESLGIDRFPSLLFFVQREKKQQQLINAIKRVRNELQDDAISREIRCNITLLKNLTTHSIADGIWIQA